MQQKFEKIRDLLVREKWDELTADERQIFFFHIIFSADWKAE